MGLLDDTRNFMQGASNSVTGMVSAPVDGISWALRKAGLGNVIGNAPVGGSDWMQAQGLLRAAPGKAGLLGESLGGVLPMVAAAKAPQIAAGMLKAGENLAAPATMNPQMGAINTNPDVSSLVALFKQKQALEDSLVQGARATEGMRAAMRDPATGQVYTGWSHQAAINSVPKGEPTGAWGRLSAEWDAATPNSGFIDKAGKFISRDEAEKTWGVSTMEDLRDFQRNQK